MISWLKGQVIKNWHLSSKKGVVINVGGIGYEVQLLSKQICIIDSNTKEYWIHQVNREDSTSLYGFKDVNQRDLFRIIISVNGIGPQIGMALLEDFEVGQLIEAIDTNDSKILTKSQGIGKRIAERLVVELKNKLDHFEKNDEIKSYHSEQKYTKEFSDYLEEIKSTLNSLGYVDNEINETIGLIKANQKETTLLLKTLSEQEIAQLMDQHLKTILIRLSQKNA